VISHATRLSIARTLVGIGPGLGLAIEPEHGMNENGTP
jgi:hypothetical protein